MKEYKKTNNTFQDNLFEIFQCLWKAGYAFRHDTEKNNHLFYTNLLEDLNTMSVEDFISKYKFYDN